MWQLLITLYFIFGATSYILRKILAKELADYTFLTNAIFYVGFLLPAALLLSLFFPHNLQLSTVDMFLLFGGSIIWPLYYLSAFQANKEAEVGIFTIINNLSPIITLMIAVPFLHEQLRMWQYVGVAVLITSGVLAASSQLHGHHRLSAKGIAWCLLSTGILGVAFAYERFMLGRVGFGTYLLYGWGAQVVWSVVLAGAELQKLPQLFAKERKVKYILLLWGGAGVLRSVSFIFALKMSGSASVISAVSDFLSVAVIIAAYVYLKERNNMPVKVVATILGIVGLLLVAG